MCKTFVVVPQVLELVSEDATSFVGKTQDGDNVRYSGNIVNKAFYSNKVLSEEKISKTALIDLIGSMGALIAEVCFVNSKEENAVRAIRACKPNNLGYLIATDISKEFQNKNSFISINGRTLVYAIIDGIKYNVK
jgi:hypothetical protein